MEEVEETDAVEVVPPAAPWARAADDVASCWGVGATTGLPQDEAARRLAHYGPNEIDQVPPTPLWRRVLGQFTDPLVVLLLIAIVVSLVAWWTEGRAGTPVEAVVIAAIVVLNAALGAWQETRAMHAVAALRRLAAAQATVLRGGEQLRIPSSDLVPGDVLLLAEGDAVGADCRLVETAALAVSEASLTGESVPVGKHSAAIADDTPLAERVNMAYQGTAVARGRGRGVVTATGMRSEIGRIAELLGTADSEPTPLERQIAWLGRVLGIVVVILAAVVIVTVWVVSDLDDVGGAVDAARVGVSLAVAAIPEGLPAILTMVLAIGVQRLAADHAVVKRLSSVETLGSASVIFTDKTGTLTRNEMAVVAVLTPTCRIEVTGEGYATVGEPLVDGVALADEHELRALRTLLTAATVANDASLDEDADGDRRVPAVRGDPTEIALLVAAEKVGVRSAAITHWQRRSEIPFDAERKRMSVVATRGMDGMDGAEGPVGETVMFVKGAPDILVDRCVAELRHDVVRPMTEARRDEWLRLVDDLAGDALRPLAIASRRVDPAHDALDEDRLVLLGVVGLIDPPRLETANSIAEAYRGGIRVVMVTGDHPRTAERIAERLALRTGGAVVSGRELGELDDAGLARVASSSNVYARVEPEHKVRLVRAVQAAGHVAAMTGDGVNDGPALRQADIGVAMGRGGTEVAREAADVVLADDNFATIVRAVREGREIYADIRKFLRYLLASNTGEVLVVLLGVVLADRIGLAGGAGELAVPLLATQILWINLATDGLLALALGVDPSVEDVMDRPPRPVTERVVDGPMLRTIVTVGFTTAIVSLIALDLELAGGLIGGSGDIETARTMAFTTLVLAQVCNAFTSRSDVVSVLVEPFGNPLLWAAAAVTVAAQVLVVHLPGLRHAFDVEPLSLGQWATCAALASVVLVVAESVKASVRRVRRR